MEEKSIEELETIKNGEAFYELGMRYYRGENVEKNFSKAFEYFEGAYNLENYRLSIPVLAEMYYYGRGTEKNYEQARKYCEMYENSITLFFLGEMYFYGKDVKIDYQKALYYYEKSLNLKDKTDDIYYKLYLLYSGDYGIEEDKEKSKEYLNKVKEDLLSSIIYFILAARNKEEYNLDAIIRFLIMDRELFRELMMAIGEVDNGNHPAYKAFLRVDYLINDEYNEVAKSIIFTIIFNILNKQEIPYIFPEFSTEIEVNNYIKKFL